MKVPLGRVLGSLGLRHRRPKLAPLCVEAPAHRGFGDLQYAVAAAAEVAEQLPAAEAEAFGHHVERDFEKGDLAQVEVGGDDLSGQARLALLPHLAEEFAEDVFEEGEFGFFVHVLTPLSPALSREGRGGRAAQAGGGSELRVAGGGVGDALGNFRRAVLLGDGHRAIVGALEAVAARALQ